MLGKILLVASLLIAGESFAQGRPGDHPFSFQVSVPISKAEGFWKAVDESKNEFIYKFTLKNTAGGKKQLIIEQYDVQTCDLFARGPGREKYTAIKDKDGKVLKTVKVIQALITAVDGSDFKYMAVLKAYTKPSEKSPQAQRGTAIDETELSISIFPEIYSEKYSELELKKVNGLAELSCNNREKVD